MVSFKCTVTGKTNTASAQSFMLQERWQNYFVSVVQNSNVPHPNSLLKYLLVVEQKKVLRFEVEGE